MTTTCPACSWPNPVLVSTHRSTRYLRCICGKWLIEERDVVLATAGHSAFSAAEGTNDELRLRDSESGTQVGEGCV